MQKLDDAHDTLASLSGEGATSVTVHVLPFHRTALPPVVSLATAAQNVDDGHDTAENTPALVVDGFHVVPSQVARSPGDSVSTAAQNVAEAHDTPEIPVTGMDEGALHAVPSQVLASTPVSDMQKAAPTQDNWFCEGPPQVTPDVGDDHAVPFQIRALPLSSPATQNVAVPQEIATPSFDPTPSEGATAVGIDQVAA
ncbi:MAG TPA: hypothetical protein VND44_11135 [Acidimicrobiales bacterium]|nr:hypothetical protein [Acidimicrobiales bacterium]